MGRNPDIEKRTRHDADPLRALSGFVATGLVDGAAHHDRYLYGATEPKTRRCGRGYEP